MRLLLTIAVLTAAGSAWAVEPVSVTLLHTNDLHSHFRADKSALALGGVARLKTAVRQIRATTPHVLFVDGGDWSEGNIYYNEGAGRETLRMMDHLTYDVAVVGNHDWINGADTLLEIVRDTHPSLSVLATNIDTREYGSQNEFRRRIPPYAIKEVGGVRVAFVGLLTYEFIYDKFFSPVRVTDPFSITRELARRLKKEADVVIAISHNSIKMNQGILQAIPEIDLVVGAHDHKKLVRPVAVERPGAKTGYVVEAGCWGRYLGRADLKVTPRDPAVPGSRGSLELASGDYRLLQMDRTVPEDETTLQRIATLEALIESKQGPIFHDHVGHSEIELSRMGLESPMGDFATDAYIEATGADLALDHSSFIYGEIHEGDATTADLFNANPGVYNPATGKAWTLRMLPISGRVLSWVLGVLYSSKKFTGSFGVAVSGGELTFDPLFQLQQLEALGPLPAFFPLLGLKPDGLVIKNFKIRGKDLRPERQYQLAAPGGVVEALEVLNRFLPGSVPLDHMRDTGKEGWRVIADHLRALSPVTMDKIGFGTRVRTVQADLGLTGNDITWTPLRRDAHNRMLARVRVRVRNSGTQPSRAGSAQVALLVNRNGVDYAVEPDYVDASAAQALSAVQPGQSTELVWDEVVLPESQGIFALTARLLGTENEVNRGNDEATRWFKAPAGL